MYILNDTSLMARIMGCLSALLLMAKSLTRFFPSTSNSPCGLLIIVSRNSLLLLCRTP
ncbi:Uncharacterised protein [Vibrio cholerae]|nr:Uncharacterised protein [Vibrio cholerae]CSC09079.1 Uncharacterised protein [Vibrio cholerae]